MIFDRFSMFVVKRAASLGDAKIIVLYRYLQCLVAIGLFPQNQQTNICRQNWGCFFEKAVGTTFSSIWLDFGFHFGRF